MLKKLCHCNQMQTFYNCFNCTIICDMRVQTQNTTNMSKCIKLCSCMYFIQVCYAVYQHVKLVNMLLQYKS